MPQCGNASGFRKVSRMDDPSKMAYVVLYTSMSELEWPDYLDEETGVFRYYGDNRKPGRAITDTKQGGNRLLTPVEMERIQGFSSDWTKECLVEGEKVEMPDKKRKFMMGNALVVNLIAQMEPQLAEIFEEE